MDGAQGGKKNVTSIHLPLHKETHVTESFALDFCLPRDFLQGVTSCFICDAQNLSLER